MPFVDLGGLALRYELHAGPGPDADTVLLLHGLGSSSADWSLQIPALAPRYRVLTLDLRAHGESGAPGRRLTVETMAGDVRGLLDRLGLAPVHAVGLSLGGCVALALALETPAGVRSLTLVNAFARLAPASPRDAGRMLRRLGVTLVAPMPRVAAMVARGLFPRPDQAALYRAAVARLARNPKRRYLAALGAVARFDGRARLGAIACPTLVIVGEADRTVPRAAQQALGAAIPGARLCVVPGSGHATNLDRADVFNQLLLDFLASITP